MTVSEPRPAGAFKVRPGRRGDAEGIKQLLAELGFQADNATVTWLISHPEMELLVAADSLDKVIGVCALSHRPQIRFGGRIATIDELAVTGAWRRKGVGKELLKRAVERARVLGVKRLEIQTVGSPDELQKAFLTASGFVSAPQGVWKLS